MKKELSLLLIGCGKMGGALLKGWSRQGNVTILVVDPMAVVKDTPPSSGHLPRISFLKSFGDIPATFQPDAVILAVKPQKMAEVLPDYGKFSKAVFLSIAAGQTLPHLAKLLGGGAIAIVRSMPNLPASIGQGMTVAVANAFVTPEQHALCDQLLRSTGALAWVDNEALLDPVTALSGSGPAYLFALVESLSAAGERLGLSEELSMNLARQTIIGAAALLGQSTESATTLRQAVTSPGGTTAAAMNHLMTAEGLPDLMTRALRAACDRSRELAN